MDLGTVTSGVYIVLIPYSLHSQPRWPMCEPSCRMACVITSRRVGPKTVKDVGLGLFKASSDSVERWAMAFVCTALNVARISAKGGS